MTTPSRPQPPHEGVQALGERAAADDVVPDGDVARDVRDRPQRDGVPLLLDEPPDGDDAHRLARPQVPRPKGKFVGHDRHAQPHELLGWAAEGLERTACMLAVDGHDVRRLEQRVVHRRTVRARLSTDVVAVERDDERRPGLCLREREPPGIGAEMRVEHVVATRRERDRRHGVEGVRRQRGIDVVRPPEQPRAGDLVVHRLARARAMVGDDVDHVTGTLEAAHLGQQERLADDREALQEEGDPHGAGHAASEVASSSNAPRKRSGVWFALAHSRPSTPSRSRRSSSSTTLSIASAKTSSPSSPLPSTRPTYRPNRDVTPSGSWQDTIGVPQWRASRKLIGRDSWIDVLTIIHAEPSTECLDAPSTWPRTATFGESGGEPRAGPREVRAAEHHELDVREAPGELDEDPRTLGWVQPSEEGHAWALGPAGDRGGGWDGVGEEVDACGLDVVGRPHPRRREAGAGDAKATRAPVDSVRATCAPSERQSMASTPCGRLDVRGELEGGDTLQIGRRPRVANPDDRRDAARLQDGEVVRAVVDGQEKPDPCPVESSRVAVAVVRVPHERDAALVPVGAVRSEPAPPGEQDGPSIQLPCAGQ